MRYVLQEVYVDKETGKLDSDVIYVGQPKSRVDKLRTMLEIISALEKRLDMVPVEDVVKEANSMGIDEHYARQLVEVLRRQGDLYEPKTGFIKSAHKREWG